MRVWRIDYYEDGYKRKYVKADDRETAVNKADVAKIVDLCFFDDTTERGQKELAGKEII